MYSYNPPRFLTISQVADELGYSERSVWRRIREGKIPTHRFDGSTRISREDLDRYIRQCRRELNRHTSNIADTGDGSEAV